jgi:hypothetical protein
MLQSLATVTGAEGGSIRMTESETEFGQLETLVLIYHSNKRLLNLLDRTKRDLEQAGAYLSQPGCNPVLGMARIGQLRERRRTVLRQLEANWLLIRELTVLPHAG